MKRSGDQTVELSSHFGSFFLMCGKLLTVLRYILETTITIGLGSTFICLLCNVVEVEPRLMLIKDCSSASVNLM